MPAYKAPLRDMRFLMNEVFDFSGNTFTQDPTSGETSGYTEITMITIPKKSSQVSNLITTTSFVHFQYNFLI